MRILFSSLASTGHLYPLLPLARAARRAGHDVVFATSEEFHSTLKEAGLEVAAAGGLMLDAFSESFTKHLGRQPVRTTELPAEPRNSLYMDVFGSVMPRIFAAGLKPLIEKDRPDLLVHEAGNPGAALAAKRAGVPSLCHAFGLAPMRFPEGFAAALRDVADEVGVALPADPVALATAGDPYLDLCPLSLQDKELADSVPRIPLRPVPFAAPGELPACVRDRDPGRPLIYLTLGTVFNPVDRLREAIAGLAVLDAQILVATGPRVPREELGEMPANVAVEAWVPQADVVPHVDLLVHHGGDGTMLSGLAAGVPQLLLPQEANPFGSTDTVVRAGVAEQLMPGEVTSEAVAATAGQLLAGEDYRAAAKTLAAEIAAMPSPQETVRRLAEFADRPPHGV